MGNTVKTIILLIMELALGTAFGFQGYRVCQSHELLVNSIWFVQCAWMLIMHLERIVLKKKVAGTSGLLAPRAVSSWTLPHTIHFRLQLL